MKTSLRKASRPQAPRPDFVLMLLTCLWLGSATTGTTQSSTASINGTVRDASGSVVPGSDVVLTNTQTNVSAVP